MKGGKAKTAALPGLGGVSVKTAEPVTAGGKSEEPSFQICFDDKCTTLTVDDLTHAIKNSIDRSGMPDDQARMMAQHVMNFFGYSERIIDNILEPEDRDAFYMLEDTGILTTEREETTLYDGREWRIHYWLFRKERIFELISGNGHSGALWRGCPVLLRRGSRGHLDQTGCKERVKRNKNPFKNTLPRFSLNKVPAVSMRSPKPYLSMPLLAGRMDVFPYPPRPNQLQFVKLVEEVAQRKGHLVLESGTGTGKTVCALSGTIQEALSHGRKVLYLTRTNSQEEQVVQRAPAHQ